MKDSIPIPGTSKSRLIETGIKLFSEYTYDEVEVDRVAAEAGVTVGSLYHHFKSKRQFYGVLRDDLTKRILDRMEGAAEAMPERPLKAAMMAAYDGVHRIKAGRIFTEPALEGQMDQVEHYLAELVRQGGGTEAEELAIILNAALKAALKKDIEAGDKKRKGRIALGKIVDGL